MDQTAKRSRAAEALFGKVRRNVLALLFAKPSQTYYQQEIVRAVGGGLGAVQRELQRLASAGLVTSTVRGNRVYYQANPRAPIFAELRDLILKTSGLADAVREALEPLRRRIQQAFIYGSLAAGRESPESDVDLMIIGDVSMREAVGALKGAQDRLGREINPTVFSPSEVEERLGRQDHFMTQVMAGPRILLIGDDDEPPPMG